MTRLAIARAALVLSLAAIVGGVALWKRSPDQHLAAFWIVMAGVAGAVFSLTAVVAFQMITAVRNQVPHNG